MTRLLGTSTDEADRDLEIALASESLEAFCYTYLREYFTAAPSRMHRELFARIEAVTASVDVTRDAKAAPRDSGKTTVACFGWPLWLAATRADRKPFFIILADTDKQAAEWVNGIALAFEASERLRADFGLTQGPVWTQHELVINSPRGPFKVLGFGKRGKIRGRRFLQHRPSVIVGDDLDNDKNAGSLQQCQDDNGWWVKGVMKAGGDPARGQITNYWVQGTILNDETILAKRLVNPGWEAKKYRSIERWPDRMDLWAEWERVRMDPLRADRVEEARAFYELGRAEMDRGAEILWPEGQTLYGLMEVRAIDGIAAFLSEHQNEPYDPATCILDLEGRARWFKLHRDRIERDDGSIVFLHECKFFGALDPSLGLPDGDFAVLVTLAVDPQGIAYVIDAWCRREPPSRQIARFFDLLQIVRYQRAGFEKTGFQAMLKDEFAREQKERRREGKAWQLPIEGLESTRRKEDRIASLEPKITHGWLQFHRGLDAEYLDQVRKWRPKGTTHDDGPDATEMAVRVAAKSGFSSG